MPNPEPSLYLEFWQEGSTASDGATEGGTAFSANLGAILRNGAIPLWNCLPLASPIPPGSLTLEFEREDDGRWLAEVPELAGVMAYGRTPQEAGAAATALARQVVAERAAQGEDAAGPGDLRFAAM